MVIPEFKTPLVLVVVPLLLAALWYERRRREGASLRFSSLSFMSAVPVTWRVKWSFLPWALRILVLVLLLVALAGPRKLLAVSNLKGQGIDIVLTLDVSGSMSAMDYKVNGHRISRLDIIKKTVEKFIKERPNDRIGLVVFGTQAYTVCPLTMDHDWLLENLRAIRIGVIQDSTAIGSGIATSLLRLKDSKAKSKVIVLLTDGVNNSGSISPLTAARAAQALGVKIYTIGAGTTGIVPFPVTDAFGNTHYEEAQFDLDEGTLKKIAAMTGGEYFRAADTGSLRRIYARINRMEKSKIREKGYKMYQPMFWFFLDGAMVLLALEIILNNTVFLKIP
ncbi:MAG: VWA domain-containing protein [Candidatus Omnitrophica bacterium]|nr:VWA domain-containing protein [Candidatus Omnitrophota bacterium]MDE2008898.1 VWA domain-containing protein [Candidatus Omnitrophota bacterium]MDE2213539.1 VWA domain-containing protein [Candidatus Omnitrophota bacterium]MDE2230560.1 VWA domain-containing protein [Candidatus Omnitrophota bacterium]